MFNILDCAGKISYNSDRQALCKRADFAVILTTPGVDITKYVNECKDVPFIVALKPIDVKSGLMEMHQRVAKH